jgi:hypothetical protein
MHPGFSFEVDGRRNLVKFVLTGLFMPEDVSAFLEARRSAHAELTCAPGEHVTLTDLRAIDILPKETVMVWSAHLADPQTRVRRLAFVVGPTLVRGQLARALAGRDPSHTRTFTDPADAEAWLMEEDETITKAVPCHRTSYKKGLTARAVALHPRFSERKSVFDPLRTLAPGAIAHDCVSGLGAHTRLDNCNGRPRFHRPIIGTSAQLNELAITLPDPGGCEGL